jgi:hypothetical protein
MDAESRRSLCRRVACRWEYAGINKPPRGRSPYRFGQGQAAGPAELCLTDPAVQKSIMLPFDAQLIGIDPDYRLQASERLLMQKAAPMLEALKQSIGEEEIHLRKRDNDRPDRDRLSLRFESFRVADFDVGLRSQLWDRRC